jgi:transcriptional regulator with XRE-family HTH domain
MKFGEKLKSLRKKAGLTQGELAKQIGISDRALLSYEKGVSYPRHRETYYKLAEILNVDANYLITEDEEFITQAREKYGYTGAKQAQELVNELTGLFAGGELEEEDMDALANAVQEAYWIAKINNKKYTPKKYKK